MKERLFCNGLPGDGAQICPYCVLGLSLRLIQSFVEYWLTLTDEEKGLR